VAFYQVGKQANRIKCATIGFKAMEQIIKEVEE
jgi:nitrogen fixation NifU-like protein